ncbi:MAG: hypothetical protein Q8Q73_02110 [Stagnimonas sp.]|nr:hypothetical protein [Stagnimonas sp.]
MKNIDRRSFVTGVAVSSLPSLGYQSPAYAYVDDSQFTDDSDFPHGCIFARMECQQSISNKLPQDPTIDFWTFRVSEIESTMLPTLVSRVVVWDDVFSARSVVKSAKSILDVIPQYHGFNPLLGANSFAFHLEGVTEIGSMATKVLPEKVCPFGSQRIALIDIESCGVSRYDWPDVLPHLHAHYDLVVGFSHFPGRGPSHLRKLYDGALDNSRTWAALACCNLSFLTSDALLGFDDVLDCDVRHPYLNALLHDLIQTLSTIDFIQAVTGASGAPSFGIGPLPPNESGCKSALEAGERQSHNISSEFSGTDPTLPFAFVASNTNRSRLVSNDERFALWPLRPRTKSGT